MCRTFRMRHKKTPGRRKKKRLPGVFVCIYFPWNTGFLFSRNALTASAWSAEWVRRSA